MKDINEMNETEFQEFKQQLETAWTESPLYAVIRALRDLNKHYMETDWLCMSPTCTRDLIATDKCPICFRLRPDIYRVLREYGVHVESGHHWLKSKDSRFDMNNPDDLVRFWVGRNNLDLPDEAVQELQRFIHNAIQRAKS